MAGFEINTAEEAPIAMSKTVLFVDDEGDWRLMAATVLEEAGYKVMTAKNGSDALMRSNGVQLSVIVLDINLAGENGVVFMEFLKRNHPGVPIILYTGMDYDGSEVDEMMKKGAHQFLRKGTMQQLLNAVKQAAQHRT